MTGTIQTVGIIGAGQMGGGIAQVAAIAGFKVLLYDISAESIEKGLATISGNMARMVSSGQDRRCARQAALAKISAAPAMADLASSDLVIEAATEDETVKRKIFAQLCPQLGPGSHPRLQHLVDLDHPAGLGRPTGPSGSSACIS